MQGYPGEPGMPGPAGPPVGDVINILCSLHAHDAENVSFVLYNSDAHYYV